MRFSIIHLRMLGALVALTLIGAVPAAASTPSRAEQESDIDADRVVVLYRDDNLTPSKLRRLTEAGALESALDVRRPELVVIKTQRGRGRVLADHIRTQPGVAAVAKVGRVQALETVPPNDPKYAYDQGVVSNWGQRAYLGPVDTYPYSIGIEQVWDAIFNTDHYAAEPDRAGVPIAVIDSGYTAPPMEDTGRVNPVWNYVSWNADTHDDYWARHGTRVAGIIGAKADNAIATAGVLHATKSPLRIYKVLDSTGTGTSEDTMIAMMDAADGGAKVINLSLGEPAVIDWPTSGLDGTYDLAPDNELRELWQEVVDYCSSRGSIVVAASGNYSNDRWAHGDFYTDVLYPAACSGALAVGSINPITGATSPFSGYGPELGVMAAGEGVWTTSSTGSSSNSSPGTSYAAPLVSGALATLWSLVPGIPGPQMASLATSTADAGLGEPGYDLRTGYGRFDASALYEAMKATLPVQSSLTTLTPVSGFGFETTLTWSAVDGGGVRYRYGYAGGPTYSTTGTTGRLVLPSDGSHAVWVRAYADDRFDSLQPATTTITLDTGLPPLSLARYEGGDRYETAATISRTSFPGGAPALVIASGQNWPDGLTASVLARTVGGPLLLTPTSSLPPSVREEIARLGPRTVYLVGGSTAIDSATESMIRSIPATPYQVIRIGGADRYATAALVADRIAALRGMSGKRAVIASGLAYADALAGSPLAAREGWPILLVESDSVPGATRYAIRRLGITSTVVLGSNRAVSARVEQALPSPYRISGDDRYATSRAIADYTRARYGSATFGVASGTAFPDALAAGPLLAVHSSPLVLADELTPALRTWLAARALSTDRAVFFGGASAIPYELESNIRSTLNLAVD